MTTGFNNAGRFIPSGKVYARDEHGRQRLPVSHRGPGYEGLPGHGKVLHSTDVVVAASTANSGPLGTEYSQGDTMRKLNMQWQTVAAADLPTASRGRSGTDHTQNETYKALKSQPVSESWFTDGKEYSKDAAAKFQSKVAMYAKAGAGTFKTTYRAGKVFIMKINAEYVQQRGAGAE